MKSGDVRYQSKDKILCRREVTPAVEYAMDAMKVALKDGRVQSLAESITKNEAVVADGNDVDRSSCATDATISYPELLRIVQGRSCKVIVERSCCEKEKLFDHHYDKSAHVPTMIPRACSHSGGTCNKCGINKRFRILQEMKKIITDELAEAHFEVTIWQEARRAGTDKNGKRNTQKELTPVFKNLPDLIDYFLDVTKRCIPHYVDIRWHYVQTDIILSQLRDDEAYLSTDFTATADLCAVET